MNKKVIIGISIGAAVAAIALVAVVLVLVLGGKNVIGNDGTKGIITLDHAKGQNDEVLVYLDEGIQTLYYDIQSGEVNIKILNDGNPIFDDDFIKKDSISIRIPHTGQYVVVLNSNNATGTIKYTPSTAK